MHEYEVTLYYTGFLTRTVKAESEQDVIQKARDEQDMPSRRETFLQNFEPVLETLEPWKECDTAKLKSQK